MAGAELMTVFDHDIESVGAAVPRSPAGIAMMVRRLGVMESAYARLIWSRALAEVIEKIDSQMRLSELESIPSTGVRHYGTPEDPHRDLRVIRAFQVHMELRSPSATRLLFWLMATPDVFHSPQDLRASLGFAESSIKVFVSELRKAFRDKGMPNPILSLYRQGYCVSAECIALIKDVLTQLAIDGGGHPSTFAKLGSESAESSRL